MTQNIRNNINNRSKTLFLILTGLCLIIIIRLIAMQVFGYDYYQSKLIQNIQQESTIKAVRGAIYDRNMKVLATNVTTYRVFLSPADIETDDDAAAISQKLAEVLGLEYDKIYALTQKKNRKDETVKKNVDKDTADIIRTFISEKEYNTQIYLEASTMRYYTYGNLASSVIGAMGSDTGMFGIELQYNTELAGTDGKSIATKNGLSQSMSNSYEYYIKANDGLNIVSTIDVGIQSILQAQLKDAYDDSNASNRVAGIVMDVNTGEILAMGQYPDFDLNSPYVLDSDSQATYDAYVVGDKMKEALAAKGLTAGTEEYETAYTKLANEKYWELVYRMWENKSVSDTYEPGSTFKVITTAMALDRKVVSFDSTFSCSGSYRVAGTSISCHKKTGHGTNDYKYMLQQSCNPTLMQVAEKIGRENFYTGFGDFGYTSKTGIDLPGEASGIYSSYGNFNAVELACYSFGQTFRTTMIQQITAIASVANGGYLVTPHVVSALVDSNGNTVTSYGTEVKRQVVSSSVSKEIMDVLEDGVSGNGGAKNAYVAGYKIAAKTGTSEKRDTINPDTGEKDLRIGSCIAIAPADNPQIATLIIVDEPRAGSVYGSVVAAPYVANVMEQVLPMIGVERNYTEDEMTRLTKNVPSYVGSTLDSAKTAITKAGLSYEVVGNGETVTAQVPSGGKMTFANGKIILYTGGESSAENTVKVPKLVGMKATEAIGALRAQGLNVLISGATNYAVGSGATVTSQSVTEGTLIKKGSVIEIVCRYNDSDDTTVDVDPGPLGE